MFSRLAALCLFVFVQAIPTAAQKMGGALATGGAVSTPQVTPADGSNAGNPMSVVALGVNPDFNGWKPLASNDVLAQDISTAEVSFLNAAFHARYNGGHIKANTSIVINVVDSSTQAGSWYAVRPGVSGDPVMVFLTGSEKFEGQSVYASPFTCWSTNNTDPTGGDHHLFVYDRARRVLIEIYQEEMCSGVIYPYSARAYDLTKSLDLQNYFGGDSIAAGGGPMSPTTYTYEETSKGVPLTPDVTPSVALPPCGTQTAPTADRSVMPRMAPTTSAPACPPATPSCHPMDR